MLAPLVTALALLATAPLPRAAAVPITLVNNHVFVDVRLNGAGPFHFVVDSGAGNLVDPIVAAQIRARVRGHVQLVGVGATARAGGVTTIDSVAIGNATFGNQRFIVAPTRATLSAAEGPEVDGLIGRSIIGSGITVFDYAHALLTFFAADDALVHGGTTVLPVTLRGGLPQIPCLVASVSGACTVDTGSRLAVSVLGPFAGRNPAVVPRTRSATGVNGYGIGGAAYGRLALLSGLTFGSVTLLNVPADFSVQEQGVFADESTAANVGGAVWRRFTLIFDLPHAHIGLRPNDDFDAPYQIDRSGLFLITRADAIVILDVRPQTSAERAGLRPGDVIVTANGQRYTRARLPALRNLLEGPAETVVRLLIARGSLPRRTISFQLENYL